jgi:hypothetical protein
MTRCSCEIPTLEGVANSENYDPDHPDADWSGFVSVRSQRKHIPPCQPNQLCTLNSFGLGPKEDATTADWVRPTRKIFHQVGAPCGVKKDVPRHTTISSSTFSLIGGPVPVDSPNLYSPECWETEAQAAARKRKTNLQQLTTQGRSKYVKGKKMTCDALADENKQVEVGEDVGNINSEPRETLKNDSSKMAGFRSNTIKLQLSDPTFLKGIGDAMEKLRPSHEPSSADNSAAFGPYRTATGERRKDLLVENFRSVIPGYTGKRTCIS